MTATPSVEYDPEADALYIAFLDAEVDRTEEIDDFRMVDYTSDDRVVGIEFLRASAGISLRNVPLAESVGKAIGRSGHQFKVFA
jgi:uncharacterized protein YuzE